MITFVGCFGGPSKTWFLGVSLGGVRRGPEARFDRYLTHFRHFRVSPTGDRWVCTYTCIKCNRIFVMYVCMYVTVSWWCMYVTISWWCMYVCNRILMMYACSDVRMYVCKNHVHKENTCVFDFCNGQRRVLLAIWVCNRILVMYVDTSRSIDISFCDWYGSSGTHKNSPERTPTHKLIKDVPIRA